MAALTSTLIFQLLDKVSGPAKAVAKSLGGITDAAGRAGRAGTSMDRLNRAIASNNAALSQTRGRLVDAAAGFGLLAVAIGAPVKAAVEFETVLEDIGQKLNFGQERFAEFGAKASKISKETTQGVLDVAKGFDTLAGLGASESQAEAIMKINGKAATAYRASLDDLNNAGYAAMDNLKIADGAYKDLVDGMAEAGKAGAFELKDMAQYFPALTAGYASLKQTGVSAAVDIAAALQITRKGAGDASSAATNLGNVLQKITSPQTRKAFANMGVDLEKELAKAAKAGMTPIEAISEITSRTLGGDMSKLGDLFQDAQVQQGLRPLIANIDLYRKIRADAMKASGTVEADYARRLETAGGKMAKLKVQAQGFKVAVGAALLPGLSDLADALSPVVERIVQFAEANPRLVKTVVMVTGGLIGLKVALIGVQYAALLARGGLLSMILPFAKVGTAARAAAGANIAYQASLAAMGGGTLGRLGKISAAFGGIVRAIPGVTMLGGVLKAVGGIIAAIFTPLGAIVAAVVVAVAAAGAAIYVYWQPLKAFFSGFFSAIWQGLAPLRGAFSAAFGPMKPIFDAIGKGISWVVSGIKDLLIPFDAASKVTKDWGEAGKNAGEVVAASINLATAPLRAVLDLLSLGIGKLKEFASASGIVNTVSGWFGGGKEEAKPAIAGARKRGGSVRAGSAYLVGEEGPEIWRAPGNGRIIPHGSTMAALRSGGSAGAASAGGATINLNPTVNFYGVTDKETMLRDFANRMADEASTALRSLHADMGIA